MSTETTDALVVRTVDFSETSLIVTLFTRKFGKISGIAKGARRLKNSYETSLDLLSSISLSFIRKRSDALDLLTEAKLRRRFRPTARNFSGFYAGLYVAELLDRGTEEYEPFPELWDLADDALTRFQNDLDVPKRLWAFLAGFVEALGEFPATRFCVECGEELPLDEMNNLERRILFAPVEGGVVCARCRAAKQFVQLVPTTIGALKALEMAQKLAEAPESAKYSARFDAYSRQTRAEFRALLDGYICHILGRRPKMQNYGDIIYRSESSSSANAMSTNDSTDDASD
ncbi:MAG: DNA repair protein RecO [Thermoguttaceae bacterium]|nr:DNA repair protein RecO [Thermoguttaceae bacterium]